MNTGTKQQQQDGLPPGITAMKDGLLFTEDSVVGYLLCHEGMAWAPDGGIGSITPDLAKRHNEALGLVELEAAEATGHAVFYLTNGEGGTPNVTTWAGHVVAKNVRTKKSWHNMAGRDGRTDAWFTFNGKPWHGVNIGWGQNLRCKRLKKKS